MAQKRQLFVGQQWLLSNKDITVYDVDEGEVICEVGVIRKFKAKFDEDGKLIIPEVK